MTAEATKKTKIYKMVLMFVDHDALGPDEVRTLLEEARYPNHIIGPKVCELEEVEVEWSDDHPLNNRRTRRAAFENLFKK